MRIMTSVMMLRIACQSPQLFRHSAFVATFGVHGYAITRVIVKVYAMIMKAVAYSAARSNLFGFIRWILHRAKSAGINAKKRSKGSIVTYRRIIESLVKAGVQA
jgi:hypothetical protein